MLKAFLIGLSSVQIMPVELAFLMFPNKLFYDSGQKQRKQSDRKKYSNVNLSRWYTTRTHVEGRENLQRLGNKHWKFDKHYPPNNYVKSRLAVRCDHSHAMRVVSQNIFGLWQYVTVVLPQHTHTIWFVRYFLRPALPKSMIPKQDLSLFCFSSYYAYHFRVSCKV